MQGRLRIIVLTAFEDVKASFHSGQSSLREVELETIERVSATKIEITEQHAAQMCDMGDAALPRRN